MTDTTSVPAAESFPQTRATGCPFDPDPRYAQLHARESLTKVSCPAGIDAYLVTGYDQVRKVLGDPRVSARGASSMHAQVGHDFAAPINPGNLLQQDGAAHARVRRFLIPEFTVKRMKSLRPYVQRIVNEHIDAMLAKDGPVDLIADFALPIPSLVICEMLGVPYADRDQFQEQSAALLDVRRHRADTKDIADALNAYMAQLVMAKLAEPTEDDLIGRAILRSRESEEPLTIEELVIIGIILLIAGHETTANMIGLSTLLLLQQPDQLARLRANPDLAESAVEEMLRYLTVVQFGVLRYALEDIEVGEQTVNAGEWLVGALSAGNRDERIFPDPDAVDIGRDAATHLAFGFGAHQCLGQQLARIELQEVFTTLYQRIPDMRLAVPFDEVPFKDGSLVYGIAALPITVR